MTDIKDVEQFLREFFVKKGIWSIKFLDERNKNKLLFEDLGITKYTRNEIIDSLLATDYSEGPIIAHGNIGMWVFGKDFFGHEIYIKIALGAPGTTTICISFHLAEHPMRYPFK